MNKIRLNKNSVIVCAGDSITDCGARFGGMGNGYVKIFAGDLAQYYPGHNFTVHNKGISGNRTDDLAARFEADCLSLSPSVVTFLIGINDVWRRFDKNIIQPAAQFEQNYRQILIKTKTAGAEIIMLEPFALSEGVVKPEWREDLNPKIDITKKLAKEFASRYIALDGIFASKAADKPEFYYTADGVHPTPAGHKIIADELLKALTDN